MKLKDIFKEELINENIPRFTGGKNVNKTIGVPMSVIIVTYPTKNSELADIIFEITWGGLPNQFRGGLEISDIFGIYHPSKESQAVKDAELLLKKVK